MTIEISPDQNPINFSRYAILDRNDPNSTLVEDDDHIEVNGVVFNKPFVEKPVSAEDHNIYMYYPSSAGGGSQRLFRKIGSRSSFYSSESSVRKEGSYIYEDFMPTDGTDVKVYTVGKYILLKHVCEFGLQFVNCCTMSIYGNFGYRSRLCTCRSP